MGHGVIGEWQRTTCQETLLPAVIASLMSQHQPKSGILAAHHYLVRTRIPTSETGESETLASHRLLICHNTDSESYSGDRGVRDVSLAWTADLSQAPEQVICLLSSKVRGRQDDPHYFILILKMSIRLLNNFKSHKKLLGF